MDNNLMSAVMAMQKWCQMALERGEKLHKMCHDKDVDCSHASYLLYAANEIGGISNDMERAIMRFLNTMKMVSVAGGALVDELGDEFIELVPPPPIHIEEFITTDAVPPTSSSNLN